MRDLLPLLAVLALLSTSCVGTSPEPEPFELIDWTPGPPILEAEARDWREIRAIVHMHSPHSHDACDGNPQPGGELDEDCLADLRRAVCTDRIDVAFLTDHPGHASDVEFEELLLLRGDDQLVYNDAGSAVGNRIPCEGGHEVLLLPGIETSRMMPLGLESHVLDSYGPGNAEDFDAIREAGAVGWVAHTEGRDITELATLGIEGMELYQLHANIAPDLREERLGLDGMEIFAQLGPFFFATDDDGIPPHPDLAPLGFLLPNEPAITALETLGLTQRIGVTGGTDAHQNVLSSEASDGERMDSYRRLMRWFNNRLRINGELTPDSARDALRQARTWIAFEVFGTPLGFDLVALDGSQVFEIGSEPAFSDGLSLRATLPSLDPRSPRSETAPQIRGLLYGADEQGRELLGEWQEGQLEIQVPGPGVYRVEVWITPTHLTPYLGDRPDLAEREVPWLYSGAVFVRNPS